MHQKKLNFIRLMKLSKTEIITIVRSHASIFILSPFVIKKTKTSKIVNKNEKSNRDSWNWLRRNSRCLAMEEDPNGFYTPMD